MLLLPRFVYRDRDSLRVGDLNEITYGYTIEIARVACLDRRCSPCRTLQGDGASGLVDARDGGDDGRDPCPCPGGFLAELGTSRFLSHGGTRCGCPRFLHFVGEGFVEGRGHHIAYVDLRQVAHGVISDERHLRAVGAFEGNTSRLLVDGFDPCCGGHQIRANGATRQRL